MKFLIVAVCVLVVGAVASEYDAAKYNDGHGYGARPHGGYGGHQTYPSGYRGGRYYYGGKYGGKCGNDGLYYRDDYSFVICSNGNSYVQPCAPGTRNSGHANYAPGYYYGYSDFCDVNLVDFGYAAGYAGYQPKPVKDSYGKHAAPAYDKPAVSYDKPSYGYDKPAYKEPAYKEPTYKEPAYKKPAYEEPKKEY